MTLKSGLFFLLAVGLLTAQCLVAQALFANDTKQPAFPGPPTQQEEESEANLEEEYRIEVENISAEKRQLTFELQRDLRILKLAQPNSEGELIPADDVRRVLDFAIG